MGGEGFARDQGCHRRCRLQKTFLSEEAADAGVAPVVAMCSDMNHIDRFSERRETGSANQTLSNILLAPHISGPTGCTLSKPETISQPVVLTDTSSPRQILTAQNVSHAEPLLPSLHALQHCVYDDCFFFSFCNVIHKATFPPSCHSWGFILVWQPTEATYEIGVKQMKDWRQKKKKTCTAQQRRMRSEGNSLGL